MRPLEARRPDEQATHPASRILIVDDEEGLRTSLAASLELEGYEVHDAPNGMEAIEYVRRQPVDLVITDVRMPGINGLDTFRAIRKIRPDLEVVMMTAFTLEKVLDEALSEGVYTVVHKPFAMEQIIELIARAIEHRMVLVVDEDGEASPIVEGLRAVGFRVDSTQDGQSAIALIRRHLVGVCLVDLALLGADGVEMCHEMRRLDPSVSIVMTSGDSVPDMVHQVMSLGGYACLRKPLAIPELVRVIARARGALVER